MKKILTMALMAVFCVGISAQNPPQKECKKECQGECQKKKKDKKNRKKEKEVKKSITFTVPKIVDDKKVIKEQQKKNLEEIIVDEKGYELVVAKAAIGSQTYRGWVSGEVKIDSLKSNLHPQYALFYQYQEKEQYAEAIQVLKEYMAKVNEEHLKDKKNPAVTLMDTAQLAHTYELLARQALTNKDNKLLKEAVDCADSLYAYIANSRKDILGILQSRVAVCQLLDEDGDVSLRTKNRCEDVIARIDSLRVIKNDEFLEVSTKTYLNNLIVTYYMRHGSKEEVVAQIMKYDDDLSKAQTLLTVFSEYYNMAVNKDAKYYIEAYYFLKEYIKVDPENKHGLAPSNLKEYEGFFKEKAEEQQKILEAK
ncbi:MAG: hypothetical protein J6C15_10635 [Bacteroidaceae bacterium]|nr:hypothetical protein [Bacteroidaceae bacterium]